MAKKVKLGTIKVTRKVTLKQSINSQQRYNQHISVNSTQESERQAVMSGQIENKRQMTNNVSSHRTSLPGGVYSKSVEDVYDELEKRRSSGDAMYDVFISHASEDKKDFVDPLVEALQNAGIKVWYDTLDLQWGKSLREQIDNGIKRSKFVIVVLSKNFFAKKWPMRELDAVLAKEELTGAAPLPIWYNISYDEVYSFSPTLSSIYSLSTDKVGIKDICQALELQLGIEKIDFEGNSD